MVSFENVWVSSLRYPLGISLNDRVGDTCMFNYNSLLKNLFSNKKKNVQILNSKK